MAVMSFRNDSYRQGITGTLLIRPTNCVPDPNNLGECLHRLTAGKAEIIVRAYEQEEEGAQATGTIIKRFESKLNGAFRVGLPEGEYCFTIKDEQCHKVTVRVSEWRDITIQPFDY